MVIICPNPPAYFTHLIQKIPRTQTGSPPPPPLYHASNPHFEVELLVSTQALRWGEGRWRWDARCSNQKHTWTETKLKHVALDNKNDANSRLKSHTHTYSFTIFQKGRDRKTEKCRLETSVNTRLSLMDPSCSDPINYPMIFN